VSRKLKQIQERYGEERFIFNPPQDKSMINEEWHEIVDIPVEVRVYKMKENRESTAMFRKYITASRFDNSDDVWYMNHSDGNAVLLRMLLDKEV